VVAQAGKAQAQRQAPVVAPGGGQSVESPLNNANREHSMKTRI
jgi:hypothetical protein